MCCLPADRLPELRLIPDVSRTAKELLTRLKKCFPRVSKAYLQFLLELPARKGILFTLEFATQANAFLDEKLTYLSKDLDLNQKWDEGDNVLLKVMQDNFFSVALTC